MTDAQAPRWRTSTASTNNGSCVEVADLPDGVLARDTKDRTRPAVQWTAASWAAFVEGVKLGDFGR